MVRDALIAVALTAVAVVGAAWQVDASTAQPGKSTIKLVCPFH